MSIISCENLYFNYRGSQKHDLENINFTVNKGEFIILSGSSGSGKSTLLKAMTGLIPHAIEGRMSGTLKIDGRDTKTMSISEVAEHVGCVFQNPEFQLYESMAYDEFPYGNIPINEINHDLFHTFDLKDIYYRRISELSGGEKQKIAITSVLIRGQEILLLDEPLAALDNDSTNSLIKALEGLKGHKTVFVIEHRWKLFTHLADRIFYIDHGKLTNIDDHPQPQDLPKLDISKHDANTLSEPILEIEGLKFNRRKKIVLKNINFRINRKEIIGLMGPNGAGKSTLGLIISRIIRHKVGKIFFNKRKLKRTLKHIGMAFQNPTFQLFCDNVGDEIAFAQKNFKKKNYQFTTEQLSEILNIKHLLKKRPSEISFGEQHRTALCSSISYDPELVFLDEPTTGIDDDNIRQLAKVIFAMRDSGCSFIISTHDERFAREVCDKIVYLKDGQITHE